MPTYRVFIPEAQQPNLPAGIEVIESYPAFAIVNGPAAAIEELRQYYPVEELSRPAAPAPAAAMPVAGVPAAADAAASLSANDLKNVVVYFRAPVKEEWRRHLEELGAAIKRPLGDSTLVVDAGTRRRLRAILALPEVDHVEAHAANVSISPEFVQGLGVKDSDEADLAAAAERMAANEVVADPHVRPAAPGNVIATFLTDEDRNKARRRLARAKVGAIHDAGPQALVINLLTAADPAAALQTIASQPGLRSLEEQKLRNLLNNVARTIIGQGVVAGGAGGLGLTGQGEVVCVADSGLDTGNPATIHLDFRGRIDHIQSFPIAPSYNAMVTNPNGDDGPADLYSGHGTHTAGSVLGDGGRSKALHLDAIQGMAPGAHLVSQAIEQTPKWTPQAQIWFLQHGRRAPVSGLFGIPDHLGDLFQAAFDHGARIHSDSWGGGDFGAYDEQCDALDRFVWDHRDFLVLVAAGNDGSQVPAPGKAIAPGSVTPPGTAKNCLTVGASENNRPNIPDTYGTWWPQDFPRPPFKNDAMSDKIDDVVAFSSRGPCRTGRRKPDLIAPGTWVLSTRSSRIAANNFAWGAYPPAKSDYMFMGGTSMATPLVAGAAALVRQYLRGTVGIANPSAALLKATLIHGAQYTPFRYHTPGAAQWADNEQGWGRLNLASVLAPTAPMQVIFQDEDTQLTTGHAVEFKVNVTAGAGALRVTMVYSDFPGERLVNNLNLILRAPNGSFLLGNDFAASGTPDRLNNVEGIVVSAPAAGQWTIQVVASEVLHGPQPFALVVSGRGLRRVV